MSRPYRDDEETNTNINDYPILTDDEGENDTATSDRNLHVRSASESSGSAVAVPVWLRESASNFKYKWIPLPVRKASRSVATWVKGPNPPRVLKIDPYFPKIQHAPLKLLDRYAPKQKHRAGLLIGFYAIWFLIWSLLLKQHSGSGFIKGYGKPSNLWCGASFWNANNGCGLNGNRCRPFSAAHMTFRCPANCIQTELLNPYVVGNKTVQYTTLVIGGPDPANPDSLAYYRADSFICQAAIHAGVISSSTGGCGVATLTGAKPMFHASEKNGIKSIGFPSTFPRSYTFQNLSRSQAQCPSDSRWGIFAVTAVALTLLSLFTTSPATFFFSTFLITIFQVGLVSDPPNKSDFYELLSTLFACLLPATFISFVLYRFCARPLLTDLTAQVEKTVLYLGACFIGALNNYTFAPLIPIQRLTPHDLSQPGAPLALGCIVAIISAIIVAQIHYIRVSGNMPKYLGIYASIGFGLVILVSLPGLRLRIHHYILALVFMPGTAFRTRPSLIYQGLLLGLFINGVARWGFASIVQTPAALGESPSQSPGNGGGAWWGARAPNVTATVSSDRSNITFDWGEMPREKGIDGVSILINEVERWKGYTDEELYWDDTSVTLGRRRERDPGSVDGMKSWDWDVSGQSEGVEDERGAVDRENGFSLISDRPPHYSNSENTESSSPVFDTTDMITNSAHRYPEPEFYRFAWLNGNSVGRYSRAGVWDEDGAWIPPPRWGGR